MALLTLGVIVAYQRDLPKLEQRLACVQVEHIAGRTCVPESFERLVTLDGVTYEYSIAAGLSPIATSVSDLLDHMAEQVAQTEQIGLTGEPNLEQVLSLKPDLIVGLDINQVTYAQATEIAPTLMFSFDHSGQWKDGFHQFAQALGRHHIAQQVMTDYDSRLADLRRQLDVSSALSPDKDWHSLEISVVRMYPDTISLYLRDSFSGTVLQDVGLSRPPAQDVGADEARMLFDNPIQNRISRELLEEADGDVIFLWTGESTAEATVTAQHEVEELLKDPLWRQLKAVQAGRVYIVPSYWIGSGPIAASAILDDLMTYLVKPS
ncbi:iron-siderophore ABC transporter substrate-binding protein [Cyanobium sp. CH-040]|nr:iron-siderophore ABC transporter substrate-binding protein [Cyanobium sp. CH-040]